MPTYEPSEIQTLTFTNEDGKTFELKGDFLNNVTIPETTTTAKITSATTTSSNTISVDPDWFNTTTTTTTIPNAVYTTYPSYTTTFTIPSVSDEMDKAKEECKKYMDKVDEHIDKLEEDIEFLNNERLNHKDLIDGLLGAVHDQREEIDKLKSELETMKSYTNWLEHEINDVRGKADD